MCCFSKTNLPLHTTGQHKLQTHCKPCVCTFAQWICVAVLKALACRQGCNTQNRDELVYSIFTENKSSLKSKTNTQYFDTEIDLMLSKLYGKYILEAVVVSIWTSAVICKHISAFTPLKTDVDDFASWTYTVCQ